MPVLTAYRVGVRSRGRWLFRDLDMVLNQGELGAIVGAPGSGRTTLLLALTDRFRLTAGKVTLDGRAALGHVPGVHEPDAALTVEEHIRERLLLLGQWTRRAADVLAHQRYGLDPTLPGWRLTPYQRQLLGLTLACLGRPRLVAVDGVDDGLDAAEQTALWLLLGELAAGGTAVLAAARAVSADVLATVYSVGETRALPRPRRAVDSVPVEREAVTDADPEREAVTDVDPEREAVTDVDPEREVPQDDTELAAMRPGGEEDR